MTTNTIARIRNIDFLLSKFRSRALGAGATPQ
jgi:hypothetical protein